MPVQTAYRSFKKARKWDEWLELPINISAIPQSSQLAVTVWDISPTGGPGAKGHAIPFGGTTISLFDKENTLQKGRQKCRLYRHKAADGFSSSTTPAIPPPRRMRNSDGASNGHVTSPEEDELDRLEKLFKKHEMGEIHRVDWLDALVFKAVAKQRQQVEAAAKVSSRARKRVPASKNKSASKNGATASKSEAEDNEEDSEEEDEDKYTLLIDLPRFDFPIVFTDHEYAPPPLSSLGAQ